MKKLVVTSAEVRVFLASLMLSGVVAGSAVAADNWTGFYIGGHVGWADSSQNGFVQGVQDPSTFLPNTFQLGSSSALGGVHLGYNRQLTPNLLVGAEGDFTWLRLNKSEIQPVFCSVAACGAPPFADPGHTSSMSSTVNWLASLRARVGFIGAANWLIYGTWGLALADVSLDLRNVIRLTGCNGGQS